MSEPGSDRCGHPDCDEEIDGGYRRVGSDRLFCSTDHMLAFYNDEDDGLRADGGPEQTGSERGGVLVRVHEHTGEDGVIVELRPEDHDTPWERDMERLSMDEARELHRQLSTALIREDPQSCAEQVADELMAMIPPEEIPCDFADQIDAAQSALRFAAEREPAVDLPVGDSP